MDPLRNEVLLRIKRNKNLTGPSVLCHSASAASAAASPGGGIVTKGDFFFPSLRLPSSAAALPDQPWGAGGGEEGLPFGPPAERK